MTGAKAVGGSFRDPAGRVYQRDDRLYRTVTQSGRPALRLLIESPFIRKLVDAGRLVPFTEVPVDRLGPAAGEAGAEALLELTPLQFVSHPYEWPFPALKRAALAHLDLQLDALEHDIALIDASAYNIQFRGPHPIFIDHLSFRPYEPDSLWLGHRQFCDQFLNPLLLQSVVGLPYNAWYRGTSEGVAGADLRPLLPLRSWLSPRLLTHVILPELFDRRGAARAASPSNGGPARPGRLPKPAFRAMLAGLRGWIAALTPKGGASPWKDYASANSYSAPDAVAKRRFVAEFTAQVRPAVVWDLGCNTGEYAEACLAAGAETVIGFDGDGPALEAAFGRAEDGNLNFLPLHQEFHNPSPDQGWNEAERAGLKARGRADAVLALALAHHLAIARNIPLDAVIDWIIGLAPQGVIEFVPKDDPMARLLLANREDVFDGYSDAAFSAAITARARIIREELLAGSGRRLVWYARR